MNFAELVKARQSVREYLSLPVEREKIERCLEAARLAPSACNSQPWKYIVVDEPELKTAVAFATFGKVVSFNRFTLEAPVLIVIISEPPNITAKAGAIIKNNQLHLIDLGISAQQFCLQAVEEGLGACMLGWFDERRVKQLLHIPRRKRVNLIISLGYPKNMEIREKVRKDFNQIVSYNGYQE
ncbi:MAG: nitroreductase family protein [Firmicutes bacterium]|nr:nitroreductase family protein [Bacillota bacterium]